MKIRLADYVARFLVERKVEHVFMLPGGGAMHLNDAFGNERGFMLISNHHEQACSMAAESYSRISGNIGVALVTTGPGGTNAVTGCAGAWLDSTPCLFISGQVKRADLVGTLEVRQNGVQEIGIVPIVSSITKYAVTVMEPSSIRYHLEKAFHLAKTGRPGPVWIDLPLDVQASTIETDGMKGFEPAAEGLLPSKPDLCAEAAGIIRLVNEAQRPVLFIGNGVRLAGAESQIREFAELLNIPVLLTWPAMDLLPEAHPLVVGRPGPVAPRGANFALQNSDCLLSIGARLDAVVTGYAPDRFARAARKVMVDIDPAEVRRVKPHVDMAVCADAKDLLLELLKQASAIARRDRSPWLARCADWKRKYPVTLPEYRREKQVSTYVFTEALSEVLAEDAIAISGSAGAGIEIFLLAFKPKKGQRVFCTTALGAMGNGLPAVIGACLAGKGRQTVCVCGDGCLQLNIQEFQTLQRLRLPIKLFVLSNNGYSSIRTSQSRYFKRLSGADPSSGLTLPDLGKVASAYGLTARRIDSQNGLEASLRDVLALPGPVVCEIVCPADEPRAPCMMSMQKPDGTMVSKPLEDLWPFLEREEFLANMIIPALEE